MEIVLSVKDNLEAQVDQYQQLLELAQQKSHLLAMPDGKREVEGLNALTKEEVQVVNVLRELETERQTLTQEKSFDEIAEDAGEHKEVLEKARESLKEIATKLHRVNERNALAIEVSLKVIGKVMDTVRSLTAPQNLTYSRIKKPVKSGPGLSSLNLTV